MTEPAWEDIQRIYEEALKRPQKEREEFVRIECEGDEALIEEVLMLLSHTTASTEFLSPPEFFDTSDLAHPQAPSIPGHNLIKPFARGGMGAVVWLAQDENLGRMVAVKVLDPTMVPEKILERFKREARMVAKLDHPGIVKIHHQGIAGTYLYFSMELVEGRDLGQELKSHDKGRSPNFPEPMFPSRGGKIAIRDAVRICRDAATALHFAHTKGIVHRDIKPANILLRATDGTVKLADFGFARGEEFGNLTDPDEIGGTVQYMSPEQARISNASVDHRTDIYSLGVVLYELLTGVRPFEGASKQEIWRNLEVHAPRPIRSLDRSVPRDVVDVCNAAMAKDCEHRYGSAEELSADLDRFLEGEAVSPPSIPVLSRLVHLAQRHAVKIVAIIFLVGGSYLGWSLARSGGEASPESPPLISVVARDAAGLPLTGVVSYRQLDPLLRIPGPRKILGTLPVEVAEIAPGDYRFALKVEAFPPRSVERSITPDSGEQNLAVVIYEGPSQVAPMIPIPEGYLSLSELDVLPPSIRTGTVKIDAFQMDRDEVSNGQYREFLNKTGHAPPKHWSLLTVGSAHDRLPVTGITYADAQAFAEWAGKRLPTYLEWLHAARYPDGRRFPWGNDLPYRGNLGKQHFKPQLTNGTRWEHYLEGVVAADDPLGDVSALGLNHLLGNVQEWTSSRGWSHNESGQVTQDNTDVLITGCHYEFLSRSGAASLLQAQQYGHGPRHFAPVVGFRCASSDD